MTSSESPTTRASAVRRGSPPSRIACAFAFALTFSCAGVQAGPGAHGPNGEHLDGPVSSGVSTAASPKLEASSEAFELVATLGGGELSILIDRYATNEPVLSAALEVQAGDLKAQAKFHADNGDYAVDDPKLLALLARPGKHPLVFTLNAGEESDLLEGVLVVQQPVDMSGGHHHGDTAGGHDHGSVAATGHQDEGHGHAHGLGWKAGAAIGGFVALALFGWWYSRRQGGTR